MFDIRHVRPSVMEIQRLTSVTKQLIILTYVSISWGISSKSSKVLWLASIVWFIFLFSKICSADSMNSVHPDVSFGISFICYKGDKCPNHTHTKEIVHYDSIHQKLHSGLILNTICSEYMWIFQHEICKAIHTEKTQASIKQQTR